MPMGAPQAHEVLPRKSPAGVTAREQRDPFDTAQDRLRNLAVKGTVGLPRTLRSLAMTPRIRDPY